MRRGSQVSASGGYNKPPPGPLTHGGGRVRLHSQDGSTPIIKERFGSPRERSPSLGSVLPISPSHLMCSREKSPNPASQDLHDCSMCLSAYIQSLNTVCGTACRLAQCLSQVGSENAPSDFTGGTTNQFPQILKEAAEIWESIARVIGVTSTGVKNQMIMLIQDVQKNHNGDANDQKQEIIKIVKIMLSTFLNLHCQFSRIVFEKFSGMLQHLKDDGSNGYYPPPEGGMRPTQQASPNVSPQRPTPSPPSPHQLMQQQLYFQQQQQQLILQQQLMQMAQQQQQFNLHKTPTVINENSSTKDECSSRHSSGGSSLGYASISQSHQIPPSSPSCNTLSPGLLSTYSATTNDWTTDSISRRWSMGGEEVWAEKSNCLSPFSLMANRRWSVPETTEHDPAVEMSHIPPFYSNCNIQDPSRSTTTKASLHPLSRENSGTRSPSHSRSVTPEQTKRPSVITSEELEDVIDLLSLPLSPSSRKSSKSSVSSCNSFGPISPNRTSSIDLGKKPLLTHHRIPEVNQESSLGMMTCSPESVASKLEMLPSWPSTGTDRKSSMEYDSTDEGSTQISTPLWPPTETLPGVTLTECIADDEELDSSNCWPGKSGCVSEDSFSRQSRSRGSWPNNSPTRYGLLDDMSLMYRGCCVDDKGWSQMHASSFRRHSTDAPFYIPPSHLQSANKTRSFENLTKVVDICSKDNYNEAEGFLCLGSLNAPFCMSNNSQYTLFTSS